IAGDFTPAVGDIVGLVRSRSTWFVNGPYGAPSSGPVALVSSVNGKTGVVVLTAADVDAVPAGAEIGWTGVSVTGAGFTVNTRARIMRHATGQVEIQLDLNVSGATTGTTICTLPTWAAPTDGSPIAFGGATDVHDRVYNMQLALQTNGDLDFHAVNPGLMDRLILNQTYTP
ncbi:MAG: hypothetical protein ACRDMV_21290, partial [Streptosporangiales bacterium]